MNRSVFVGLLACAIFVVIVALPGSAIAVESGLGDRGVVSDTDTRQDAETSLHSSTAERTSQPSVNSRDFDTTTFDITIHTNGTATWTFRYEQRFASDEDEQRENFEAFAEQFEANADETELFDRFQLQVESMADISAEATDREMEATNFNRSARIEGQLNPVGVVEMSFTWHGFAAVDDDQNRLTVGDVFQGIYITEEQTIIVDPGDELTFQSADPDPQYAGTSLEDAPTIRWSGEREFIEGHPRIVLEPDDGKDSGVGNANSMLSDIDSSDTPWTALIAIGGLLVLGATSLAIWYRRRSHETTTTDTESATTTTDQAPPHSPPSSAASPSIRTDEQPADPLDDELLSDEDRVVKLIRENGGRMKQVNIVEETGWSKSKVSMLLSDMEDEGTISKLRVGRENIISLEGFEPEATKSPFDE
ncbi:helix-turn-helix transcriptional regulator [Natronobacterium gregoryi]|uniref:Membrane protein n=2 Tax=Natronobacterium gregoryi TaxID=44930 RepID=L0AIW7_NATGS|nr:hypothetical protein [Natronobacterium gregoryi]AFZ73741.1 hypothetical protein Natgr_2588 [Natronobacterium gregoryi SP2]ELY65800.1 membrane protein [Natronobacterium gregoryi SP2]PLK19466.1 hypothetical protein CYV19_14790 [Natronobacterium gregoryi SP2]SFJ48064.1 hypothetical protein SAMN05443661_13317 [Natronobacterium gregoryi]